ncbi:hypothetical protein AWJ20_2232 [Sugiyamaella lignohabitans]|uniref:CENP-V/GFA domain-containing protein n=1 Tax=Sugiyamaella lignohabitans TaxID=796027 RepID=A0A161HM39_9ASCO|nr:uncharacterized protein AWJ20_2232 [Sugiyamaella lignohabitans]ANB14627.1 hypothetical protein AWJ20_2232 [Sugiyamaella lignohabitans]
MSAEGSCLCGAVGFTAPTTPIATLACYCSDCRKGSGHLGQILAKYNESDVKIHDDKKVLKEYIVTATQSGFIKKKLFCGECGCTLLTIPTKHEGLYMVRSTLMDDPEIWRNNFVPAKALFDDSRKAYLANVDTQIV